MRYPLEYSAWLIQEFLHGYSHLYAAAFVVTLGLQVVRQHTTARRYRILWAVLAGVGFAWGDWALWKYIAHFMRWYDAYFLLPGILLGVGLAKLQQFVRLRTYAIVLSVLFVVIGFAHWLMRQYPEQDWKYNPWFRAHITFEIHEWLSGRGWPGPVVPSGGSNGVGLGILYSNGRPSIEWQIYCSWGIPLLASALAVPPKLRSRPEADGRTAPSATQVIESRKRQIE